MANSVLLFGPLPGGPEVLIILLIVVLLFGAQKIPKLARSTGQAMGEFKKGREEVEDELRKMQEDTIGEEEEEDPMTSNTTGTDTVGTDADAVGTETETERGSSSN